MTNREKFREELAGAVKKSLLARHPGSDVCGFIKDKVWPSFLTKEEIAEGRCDNSILCNDCTKAFVFWLDEEYEEPSKPEVDWENVPVDTLVRVRDCEDDEWVLRYFAGIDEEAPKFRFMAWGDGATSKTAYGNYTHWKYCELVEDAKDKRTD